ncbi:uncharacterized protein Triagg1_5843 [Trichoderma aggressivum f. europaeum]|uniref:Uncharacterized protein n=1 Tax=Trichoderma aggressivum f. europaeum TaxID=173218 RepID=A0AAE1M254_9HYPO|nr:hypothetical protein Triagg1_5843 [Trichoderma aggressivum f. europaeum]
MVQRPSSRDGFHFAIICALPLEFDAVCDSLDEVWEGRSEALGKAAGDLNRYTLGCVGNVLVVVVLLPGKGKVDAASAAASLRSSYNNLRTVLVVGICGALPNLFDETETEVLLGDVIMSEYVVRYDFGSQCPDDFKPNRSIEDTLGRPNKETRILNAHLKTQRYRDKLEDSAFKLLQHLQAKMGETKHRGKYDYPGPAHDRLFDSKYRHKHQDADACNTCRACISNADPVCESALRLGCADLGCSNDYLIPRDRLKERERAEEAGSLGTPALVIHTGGVGSADTVMKSGEARDRISRRDKVIAFEKEGAGVWDELPSCIIIKGVCDYADSHKPKGWQKYAAATAASTAKALLLHFFEDGQTKARTRHRIFSVPFAENHGFVGRKTVVKSLVDDLFAKRKDRVALVGIGGVGKTQVALRIAYLMDNREAKYSILWLPAFSMATFQQACADLVKKLNLPSTKGDDARELIQQHLSSERVGRWLLILDNADSEDVLQGSEGVHGIYAYLPRSRRGQILVTTRWRKIAVDFAKQSVIEIAEMEHNEAKKLLQNSLSSEHFTWEDHTVNELLHSLTYLPLAIAQAAAYMDIFRVPIEEYLRLCRHSQQDMMELMHNRYQNDTRYDESQGAVATTWLVSFNQLQKYNKAATKLLLFIIWIKPQAIPWSILPDVGSEQEKVKAIGTLSSFGFLRARPERGMFDMHSLVHMVIRFWAHEQGIDTRTKADVLHHLAKVFISDTWDEQVEWRSHLPHVLHVFKTCRQIDPISASKIGFWAGAWLLQDGRVRKALTVIEQVVKIRETALVQDDPLRLASQRLLGIAYQANGQVKESMMLIENIQRVTPAEDQQEQLELQQDLAQAYLKNEQFEAAITLLEDIVKIEATILLRDDISRLLSQHLLAVAYRSDGQIEKAITILEKVVKIKKTTLPHDDQSRLASEYQLAIAYQANGQFAEAIALLEYVEKIITTTHTRDHPSRPISQHRSSVAYGFDGLRKTTITLLERVVNMKVALYTDDDQSLLKSQQKLAVAYTASGQIKEAIALLEHVVNVEAATLTQNDPSRLFTQRQLAKAYRANGRIKEAIALLEHVVKIQETVLAQGHPAQLSSQHDLAELYEDNGQLEEAFALYKACL